MLRANLGAVLANPDEAGVDTALVTGVFHSQELRAVVQDLAPSDAVVVTVQLTVAESAWRARVRGGPGASGR